MGLAESGQARGGGTSGAALRAPVARTATAATRCVDCGAENAARTSPTAGSSLGGSVECAALIEQVEAQRFISRQAPFIEQQHELPDCATLTPAVMKTTFSRSARAMAGRTHRF